MIKCAKLLKRSHIPWVREKGVSGVNGYLVEQIFPAETPFSLTTSLDTCNCQHGGRDMSESVIDEFQKVFDILWELGSTK